MSEERMAPSDVKAALYARVSSERQAEKDLSIPAQLKALRQHAEKQGWKVVEQFVDEAESARTADRPEFQRMIGLSRQKKPPFTVILVWKLSRFTRATARTRSSTKPCSASMASSSSRSTSPSTTRRRGGCSKA